MSHNGEINTLRGNMNSMVAREGNIQTDVFGDKLAAIFPVIESDCTDSGSFDAVLEFLLLSGRSLAEAVMMMIPEAWQSDEYMATGKKAFYEFHSALMEPWDGPASIVFSDGQYIGAVLDRNGLRPSRYYLTHDDKVIMASEVGVLQVDPTNVKLKGRLEPGKMFLLDFEAGRLIPDEEVKQIISAKRPYGEWLAAQKVTLADIASVSPACSLESENLLRRMQAFGYTTETLHFMLIPLVTEARDPLGSMGCDSSLACLSDKPRMIYDYFKQLFAQVTNPAIDSIREEVVMSLECFVGPEGNLLESTAEQVHRLSLEHPILSNRQLTDIKQMNYQGMRSQLIDITYEMAENQGFQTALDRICIEAAQAIEDGFSFIILSDRKISQSRIPLSAMVACGAVHHHLIDALKRTQIGIVLETGEAREVHQHGEAGEQLHAFGETAEHRQRARDILVIVDAELLHVIVLVGHFLIFEEGGIFAFGHADRVEQVRIGRDVHRLHVGEGGEHHLDLGRLEHTRVLVVVAILHLDIGLREETEDLREQIALVLGELLRPVAAVLAERHFLGHPVDLLLAFPEVVGPGVLEGLVGLTGFEQRHLVVLRFSVNDSYRESEPGFEGKRE